MSLDLEVDYSPVVGVDGPQASPTYDVGTASQVAPRDAGVLGSGAACQPG